MAARAGLSAGSRGARRTRRREGRGRRLRPSSRRSPTPPRAPQPRQSRLRALSGPGRIPLTSQAAAAPRGAEPGPGGGSRRDGRGVGARGGVRGEPGPGVGPAAPLSVVPLFEIGAGGALRSRDGASPIGTGLSPRSGPERSASRGAAAAEAGRAGKAAPGLEGRAGGTRGRADGRAASSLLRPAPDRPASVVDFLPGQRTPLPRLATHGSPARLSARGPVGSGSGFCPAGLRLRASAPPLSVATASPGPAPRGPDDRLFPRRTFGKRGRYSGRAGRPSRGLTVRTGSTE